jgi:hypothetical protein
MRKGKKEITPTCASFLLNQVSQGRAGSLPLSWNFLPGGEERRKKRSTRSLQRGPLVSQRRDDDANRQMRASTTSQSLLAIAAGGLSFSPLRRGVGEETREHSPAARPAPADDGADDASVVHK